MIEHLMSSSLSGGYQGCAAGLIWLHVRGLHFLQLIARAPCATGAGHTDIFSSIRYLSQIGSDQREKNPMKLIVFDCRRLHASHVTKDSLSNEQVATFVRVRQIGC
jgi:hypothetical protein